MPFTILDAKTIADHQNTIAACSFLLAVSAWLAFKIMRHTTLLLQHLAAAAETVSRVGSDAGQVRVSALDGIDREMSENMTAAPFWKAFRNDMLQVQEEDKILCVRTASFNASCGAQQFFSMATRFSSYEKIPSWITAMGLIFTFLMLMHGLAALHVGDGGTIVGVPTLVNSLSTKFSSSITALGCSLLLSLYLTRREHQVEVARRKFVSSVDRLFELRSIAHLTTSGNEHLQRMADSIRHLSTDLGERLSDSMTHSLGPQFDKFSLALDRLATHQSSGINEVLKEMLDSFKSTLTQSTSGDFSKLREAISTTAQTMEYSAQQAQSAAEETRTLVDRLGEQVAQQAELARKTTQQAAESMATLSDRHRHQAKEDTAQAMQGFQALAELVRTLQADASRSQEQGVAKQAELNASMLQKIDQQIESLMQRTGDAVTSQQAAQQEALTAMVSHVGDSIAQQRSEQGAALAEMSKHLEHTTQQRAQLEQQAMASLLQSVSAQSEAMLAQLSEAARSQREQMQRVAENTISASSTTAQSTLEMARSLTAKNDQAAQALQEASSAIGKATQAYHLALQSGEQIVGKIASINLSLAESAGQAAVTSSRLTEAVSNTASQQSVLTGQQRDAQALVAQADEVFSRLQGGMGTLLADISTHLADYQRQTQAGLQQNLQRFDESLGGAVGHLKQVIDELSQELGTLEDVLQQHRSTHGKRSPT